MKIFKDRVAVITGAANGIGYGLAERFAAEGMKLVLADIDAADLEKACAQLRSRGTEVIGVRTDVTDPEQVRNLADAAVKQFGAVHVLCNNAGVGGFQRFNTTTLATWRWTLDVNQWGPIYGCHFFLPILAQQEEAHIVNTASMAGFVYSPYHHPYNVSKAGVVALSEGLYQECLNEMPHVGVSVLCPAQVATLIAEHDERHAPANHTPRDTTDQDLQPFRDFVKQSLTTGMPPSEVADKVVTAIRTRQLHIITHEDWRQYIKTRIDCVVEARNPENLLAGLQ